MRPSTTCSLRLSRFHEFHAVLKLPTTRLVLYWTWLDALHDVVRRHAPPKDTEHIGISSQNEEPRIFTRFPNAMFTLDSQKGNLLAQVLCVKSFVVLTCVHLISESFWTQEKKPDHMWTQWTAYSIVIVIPKFTAIQWNWTAWLFCQSDVPCLDDCPTKPACESCVSLIVHIPRDWLSDFHVPCFGLTNVHPALIYCLTCPVWLTVWLIAWRTLVFHWLMTSPILDCLT